MAKISEQDTKFKGTPLSMVRHIIAQDRANVHKFSVRYTEDELDDKFTTRERRLWLSEQLANLELSPALQDRIKNKNPLLRVIVFENGKVEINVEEHQEVKEVPTVYCPTEEP